MVKSVTFAIVLVFLIASSCLSQINPTAIFGSLQTETHWKVVDASRSFDSKNLASLRPKDASIFNEYGFKRVDCQDFEKEGNSISVELYEMEDVTAAYGIFTFLRNNEAKSLKGIGNLGQQQNSLVSFI